MRAPTHWSRRVIAAIGLFAVLVVPLLVATPVQAFKPYTHVHAADQALEDVVADGKVTIDGREYTVNPRVVLALQTYPQFFRGGTIGPDGFPDLFYGQGVIHPEKTGEWMRYVLAKAWEAQTSSAYPTDAERLQILAFGYGYLAHAAGDMWAHTLVNDSALGVFPAVGEILTDADKAAIAIRHIIIEGYIGDATGGFDGNKDRTTLPNGDVSDDSTPSVTIDAPHLFVYNTLIDPNAPTPAAGRGPILDAFISLRAALVTELGAANPQPLQDALNAYDDTVAAWNELESDCNFGSGISDDVEAGLDVVADLANCPIGLLELGITVFIDSLEAFWELASGAIELAVDAVKDAYIAAWIDDIDAGMLHWNELGLGISRALFDPQSHRDTQNEACDHLDEGTQSRANCENLIGVTDVLFHEVDPFINDYLLSMAGLPDVIGDVRAALQDFAAFIDDILNELGSVFEPLKELIALTKEAVKQIVLDLIEEATGVDIEQLKSFLTNPTYWLNVTSATIQMPGDTTMTVMLFQPGTHEKLDAYLGLGDGHHEGAFQIGNFQSTRLADNAEFGAGFAAYNNVVTTAKLLLLDAAELNRAMGDSLVAQGMLNNASSVTTYPAVASDAPTNVMFHPLTGTDPWLQSIDSDHSWRSNPLPVFCEVGSANCNVPGTNPIARDAALNAGNGQFPLWESCLLRPAFRDYFQDWENGAQNFPDLNDPPSADASDPNPPVSTLTPTGNVHVNGGTTYIGDGHSFTLGATDTVFTNSYVNVEYRFYPDGTTPGAWLPLSNGGTFAIPTGAGDGVWRIDYRTEDPCHTFVDESGTGTDPLPSASSTTTVILDTTAPVITIVTPLNKQLFDSDDFSAIDFTLEDGVNGSGVETHTVTLDGGAAVDGQVLDMFLLATGVHTIHVTAVDNLGNGSQLTWTFSMQATSQSLIGNLDRGFQEGLITNALVYLRLRNLLVLALIPHNTGNHQLEWHRLAAFQNEIKTNSLNSIDKPFGAKMTLWAGEIIKQRR